MIYSWQARSVAGELRTGTLEAATPQAAADALSSSGLVPVRIEAVGAGAQQKEKLSLWKRLSSVGTVSLRRKALFYRQFAAVVEAGISLGSALSDLAEGETYRPLSCRIEAVRRHVAAGEALHAALAAGHLAGAMEQALLAAGEESGRLGESLALLAQDCERRERLRGRILSAMVYPGFVLCFSGAVVTVMFYWVLPRFREVFARMNMEMPPLTKLLFGLSEHFPALALGLLFGLPAGGALWTGLRRIAAVRVWTDLIRLKLPVAGRLIRCASLSRGLRSLGVMLSAGVPMLRALELAADAAGNAAVAAAFLKLRQAALEGTSLSKAAAEIDFFKPVAFQLIAAGEKTGRLDAMLQSAAGWYENDLEENVKRLSAALEPVLTLLVGGVAALVAAGIFAPVLHTIQELSAGI